MLPRDRTKAVARALGKDPRRASRIPAPVDPPSPEAVKHAQRLMAHRRAKQRGLT